MNNESTMRKRERETFVQVKKRGGEILGSTVTRTKKRSILHARGGIVRMVLWLPRQRSNHRLLVFAFFRIHSACAGAPTTLGRSTPSCGRLVVRVSVLKEGGAKVCGSNVARAGKSYIVIELIIIILVKFVELVVVIHHIVLERLAGEIVNGTRDHLFVV